MGCSAVIFPGQGSQVVGMGREVAEASAAAKAIFDRANDVIGFDLAVVCFEGPAEKLERTDVQQPAIFVTSVALWEAFKEAGGERSQFAKTGGLSLGEYTAHHVAGSLSFEDALKLVHRRGQLMQEASTIAESGMVCLIGADESSATALCERAREGEVLAPANFNCPGQVVISGSKAACERAAELAGEFSCRAVALPVAGAFHSPFMEPAAEGLQSTLEQTHFAKPMLPVVANVDCEYHTDPVSIRDSLKRQLTKPVLWQKCIERMIEEGVDRFVEMGPGRVLTGMMRKINRKMTAVSVRDAASMADLVAQPSAK